MKEDKKKNKDKQHEAKTNSSLDEQLNQPDMAEIGSDKESNLESQLAEEKQRRIQLMADFDNYRKRIELEKATFGAIANMGLIQEILEIHDDLELAMQDEELNLDRAKASIKSAQDKLTLAAKSAGIEKIDVKIGDVFNKETMEAISTVPSPDNKDKVIAVISSAYKYVGRDGILKAAKVIVGK